MSKRALTRTACAAAVVAAGFTAAPLVTAPLALAAPAPAALPCLPGAVEYPPGVCTYNGSLFGLPIQIVTSGNHQITITFGQPPFFSVGFGDRLVFTIGGIEITPLSSGLNSQGNPVATFDPGAVPGDPNDIRVSVVPGTGGSAGSGTPGGSLNAVSQDALTGTGSVNSINTGQPGNGSGPNLALVGGGAAVVVVAVGGGIFLLRRRRDTGSSVAD